MRRPRTSSFDRLHVCSLNQESSGGGRARRLARQARRVAAPLTSSSRSKRGLISKRFDKSSGLGRKKQRGRRVNSSEERAAKEAASKSAIYSISQYSRPSRSPSSPTQSESFVSISGGETCVQLLQDPVLKYYADSFHIMVPFQPHWEVC